MAEAKPHEGITHTLITAERLCNHFLEKDTPTYLHGPPGVGKSDLFRQLAAKRKIGFIDIRAGTKLPEDFSGIPVPDLEKKIAVWLEAEFWPQPEIDGEEGIIVFDELTDTSKPVQSCLYQVILDRCIGKKKLPAGWWPVAAGNRRQDRAAAQQLSTALANRFAHIDIEADVEAWVLWAMKQDYMGHMVPGFIRWRPNLLHSMEGADLRAFPTPRSWAQVARNIDGCPDDLVLHVVAALVGEGPAGEFAAFLRTIDLPDIDEICASPSRCRIPQEPSHKYALSCMISRYMDRQNIGKLMDYIKRPEFGADFEISCVLDASKREQTLTLTKAFNDFANRNKSLQL